MIKLIVYDNDINEKLTLKVDANLESFDQVIADNPDVIYVEDNITGEIYTIPFHKYVLS